MHEILHCEAASNVWKKVEVGEEEEEEELSRLARSLLSSADPTMRPRHILQVACHALKFAQPQLRLPTRRSSAPLRNSRPKAEVDII
jgi:hypothetical protein